MWKIFLLILLTIFIYQYDCSADIDTTYVEKYNHKMLVNAYLAKNYIAIQKDDRTFLPNNPMNLGIGFFVKNTALNFAYNFKLNFTANPKYGETESFDIQIHYYGRKFASDLFYQSYKGFFADNREIEIYPDLKLTLIGVETAYLFNGDKFSSKAAFADGEKQIKSAGSFALGGGFYRTHIKNGQTLFDTEKEVSNNLQIGINAGYAYSYVINENWFLSGMLTAGLHFGNEESRLKDGKIKVTPNVFNRLAVGYNQPSLALSLSFLEHLNYFNFSDADAIKLNSINFRLNFTKRIDWSLFEKKE
ncbi:MAG: DUF4421 domain-containing protein [Ignavibacteria bacterium]|jgi:hypothetical protein|nr:DUF4421 domain-containing protein [Ignavibacteria bacterium]